MTTPERTDEDANDRFRAMQIALVQAGTQIALEHGFSPDEVRVQIDLRIKPQPQWVSITIAGPESADRCECVDDEDAGGNRFRDTYGCPIHGPEKAETP